MSDEYVRKEYYDANVQAIREMIAASEARHAQRTAESEARLNANIAEYKAETDRRIAKIEAQTAAYKAETDRQIAENRAEALQFKTELDGKINAITAKLDGFFNKWMILLSIFAGAMAFLQFFRK